MMNNHEDDDKRWTKGSITPLTTFTGTNSRGGAFQKNFVNPSFYSSSVLVPIEKKSNFSLTITSTETVHLANKSYTVYIIRVKSDENYWEIIRRYKHFRVFSEKIQVEVSSLSAFDFPTKKLIGNMSPNFVKHRKDQLQKFLHSISESQDAKVSRNLKVFLDPNFSPCLKTIVCPTKEGYLYLLKKTQSGKFTLKSQWKKVYCVIINSNLFYWKKREEIYAEANGVVQLSHCKSRIIEKDEKKSIEINENQKNEITKENKWFLMKRKMKKKKFKLKKFGTIGHSHSHSHSNINTSQNGSSDILDSLDEEVYYFSSDSDSILKVWLQVVENESFRNQVTSTTTQNNGFGNSGSTHYCNYSDIPHSVSQPNLALYDSSAHSTLSSSSMSHLTVSSSSSSSLASHYLNSSVGVIGTPASNNKFLMKYNQGKTRGDIKLGSSKYVSQNIFITNNSSTPNEPSTKLIYNNHEFTFDNTAEEDIDEDTIDLLESTFSNTTFKNYMDNKAKTLPLNNPFNGTGKSNSPSIPNFNPINNKNTNINNNNNNNTTPNKMLNDKLKSKGPNTELQLLDNEKVLYFTENIIHVHKQSGIVGSITITNYRFYFAAYYGSTKMAKKCETEGISVPLALISKITKCTTVTPDKIKYYAFELKCKDFHKVKFMHLPGSSQHKANTRLYEILESLIFVNEYKKLYCFSNDEVISHGSWSVYNPLKEFERMKIPNEEWRVSNFNSDYYHSPTYPPVLVVPKKTSDLELISITTFRSKGRIPVLCWKGPESDAVMVRCSQPVVGVTGKRSYEDERLMESIALANYSYTSTLYIMDARPLANAIANQVMGMGYENSKGNTNYSNCTLKFLGIENIHKMRDAQKKLFNAAMNENNNFDQKLKKASQVWLDHIKKIMEGVLEIVEIIRIQKASIVIHCSDGWDRTSQLCALSQLLLDPSYRTILGLQILIEKEWLSFGHKFESRIGQGSKNDKSLEYSPVFLQFIECIWQIQNQNPNAFEFNSKYLMEIVHHLYSCRFGTFLYDSENERVVNSLSTKTVSLWSYLNQNHALYRNLNFSEILDSHSIVVDVSKFQLWRQYYLQWRDFHGL